MPKLPTSYQVWVLGYNNDDCITDFNEFLGEFTSGSEATEYAGNLSLSDLKDKLERLGTEIPEDVRYLHLQVETVKKRKNWEENVDTIYENTFDLKKDDEELDPEAYVVDWARDDYDNGKPVEDYKEFSRLCEDEGIEPTPELYKIYVDNCCYHEDEEGEE